jgi:putative hemolysin
METERFELQDVANTVEIAASSSKFCKLQGKRTEQKKQKKVQNGKNMEKTIPDPY